MIHCSNCGFELKGNEKFCPICGTPTKPQGENIVQGQQPVQNQSNSNIQNNPNNQDNQHDNQQSNSQQQQPKQQTNQSNQQQNLNQNQNNQFQQNQQFNKNSNQNHNPNFNQNQYTQQTQQAQWNNNNNTNNNTNFNSNPTSNPNPNPNPNYNSEQPKRTVNDFVSDMGESDSFVFRSIGLSLKLVFSKPVKLWGLSLLCCLLYCLAIPLCGLGIPILGIAVQAVFSVGICRVFLDAYNGKDVNSKQLFTGFSSAKGFFHTAGGMLWKDLWMLLWIFVPIAGIVKYYSYSFTPYIIAKKPDMSPFDALKYSMQLTYGYKLKIFLTDLLVCVAVLIIYFVIYILMLIPGIGTLLGFILTLAFWLIYPLFLYTLNAAMFSEVVRLKKIDDIKL